MFNPNRLSLARKRRRLTSEGLAKEIGVSPVTISRIENGSNPPSAETISLVAKVLKFPIEFFNGPDIDELSKDAASFRSLTAMTARERDSALAAGSIAYLFSDWISAKFNLPESHVPDLSYQNDPVAAARIVRDEWGIGERPISHMVKLLESKGIRVFTLSENTKNVDAFSCWRNDIPYVFLNTFKSAEHSRFDAAHELGHLVLHKHGGPNQGRAAEHEANLFASSFLMPSADLKSRIPVIKNLSQLITAKKYWGVSVAALAYRLHKMEKLTDWQYRSFCIQMNKRGYRTSEPKEMTRETSFVWKKVLEELWAERISRNKIASEIHIPLEEIDHLVFGLVRESYEVTNSADNTGGKPKLVLVD